VPQEKRTFSNLEVRAADGSSEVLEEWSHDLLELVGLSELQHFLELVQEQNLLLAVGEGPETNQTLDDGDSELSVLVDELADAIRELLVERAEVADFVHGNEHAF